jgi:hypothetical protein
MKAPLLALLAVSCLTTGLVRAQTPAPVVLQAATATAAASATAAPSPASTGLDSAIMLQLMREMQATNAATLKRQEAALATLDQLQKAAEELKIFSKRG